MPSGTFSADGEISPRRFTADALLVGRLRHSRALDHSGTQDTTVVVLEQSVGRFPPGTTVQTVLEDIVARITALEAATHIARSFVANALIAWHVRANAIFNKSSTSTLAANAVLVGYATPTNSISASALLSVPSSGRNFKARAYFVDRVT